MTTASAGAGQGIVVESHRNVTEFSRTSVVATVRVATDHQSATDAGSECDQRQGTVAKAAQSVFRVGGGIGVVNHS